MKLYIIGPSGAGKTTLAREFSAKMGIGSINLDYVLFKPTGGGKRELADEKDYQEKLEKVLRNKVKLLPPVIVRMLVFNNFDFSFYAFNDF